MDLRNVRASRQSSATIPTPSGNFNLCVYRLVLDDGTLVGECGDGGPAYRSEIRVIHVGDLEGAADLMVRVHSECFTGDVLASLRCDCGDQLHMAMRMIHQEGRGMIIYMPQEGRGIGLSEKLKAYNLQDQGRDTVEANLELGHDADLRDYNAAALILKDFGVKSIRLMTNNPDKIDNLRQYGIDISGRVPIICHSNPFNEGYLHTKQQKMNHILGRKSLSPESGHHPSGDASRPYVTLTYAQSLDGALAGGNGHRLILSGEQSMKMTHMLRAENDAILVGIGTVLADDPQLTVRLAQGNNPQPVVLDSQLRIPPESFLADRHPLKPWVFAAADAPDRRRQELPAKGIRVFIVASNADGMLDLGEILMTLSAQGIGSVMVEGGLEVISRFLGSGLVDRVVITINPRFTGGKRIPETGVGYPELVDVSQFQLGDDIIVGGQVRRR